MKKLLRRGGSSLEGQSLGAITPRITDTELVRAYGYFHVGAVRYLLGGSFGYLQVG